MAVPDDPIEHLRRATRRGLQNLSYRISVSPSSVNYLLKEYDRMRRELDEQKPPPNITHTHHAIVEDSTYEHAHAGGDIPHGHHGSRYGHAGERPEIKL